MRKKSDGYLAWNFRKIADASSGPIEHESPIFLAPEIGVPMRIQCLIISDGAEVVMLALGSDYKYR